MEKTGRREKIHLPKPKKKKKTVKRKRANEQKVASERKDEEKIMVSKNG